MPPHQRRAGYIQLTLGVAVVAVVLLTLTGKMHWLGAALTGAVVVARQALPVLIRTVPFLHQWWQKQQNSGSGQNQQSQVNTSVLHMRLDHSSGELSGKVVAGPYKDWRLDELNREQLRELLNYCRSCDEDSAQLLSSYLEQRFPDGFDNTAEDEQEQGSTATGGLTRSEALAVLGLDESATDEDIIKAHRSLIQKLHPDRGGNDYLAAKINEAKDFLLG